MMFTRTSDSSPQKKGSGEREDGGRGQYAVIRIEGGNAAVFGLFEEEGGRDKGQRTKEIYFRAFHRVDFSPEANYNSCVSFTK